MRAASSSRALDLLRRASAAAVAAMFACVFLIFVYKVGMRYLAADPVAWADEISVVLFVWIIFFANACVIPERRQIAFDLVYRLLPPAAQRLARAARLVLVGGLFLWALPGVVDYTLFLWRERTPVLGLRLDAVYSCFALFAIAVVVRAAIGLVRLCGRDWRQQV